jgi:hypothetical protein
MHLNIVIYTLSVLLVSETGYSHWLYSCWVLILYCVLLASAKITSYTCIQKEFRKLFFTMVCV